MMKLSKMIEQLQDFLEKHGDLDCWYTIDDELNYLHELKYTATLMYVDEYGESHHEGWYEEVVSDLEEDEERPDPPTPVCLVN